MELKQSYIVTQLDNEDVFSMTSEAPSKVLAGPSAF